MPYAPTLMDKKQEDVFITMAGDIIEYSNVETDDIALLKVLRRYNAWLKLLDHKSNAVLGSNTQKGLIGELLFLKEKIDKEFQQRKNILDEEYQKLRRNYASTNE